MFVFINGAFGIGKTSVAKALVRKMPGARIYDPEPVRFVLQKAAKVFPVEGRESGDFQDMPAWRKGTVTGLRASRMLSRHTVVPMSFSNLAYQREIEDGVRAFEPDIRRFCLIAPLAVVKQRLAERGVEPETRTGRWVFRRAEECCLAHADPAFGEPVSAEGPVESVAEDILRRLALSEGRAA